MPKSKRSRVGEYRYVKSLIRPPIPSFLTVLTLLLASVALTQTDKVGTREHKTAYIQKVREAIDQHPTVYLFTFENMRSSKFKNVRLHFPGRIFLGKNKLLQIALGRTPEEEYADNLRHVAKRITGGSVGLLLTSSPRQEVEQYFASLVEPDFARAGSVAPRSEMVTSRMLEEFPVSMMEQLRKLGMPVEIQQGKVVFRDGVEEFRICKEEEVLSVEKCKILKHFGIQLADFRVTLACRWEDGAFEVLDEEMS